ncbi:Outer membrane protein TolC [Flavobacterium swingsii]|uniref:Outer membrane protein TolC n=1 Tax=Flavobacterium swingsii TaxID=498292 RepID=A0A1I0WFN4_9FLAO|nr:TolC family protein [Flavobacterium swingsii]SFA87028.1 Outer membrane protein TolC [Flavobacterium swingsii]
MKIRARILIVISFLGVTFGYAQERKILSLKEAISLVTTNSNEAVLANMKVNTSKLEMETMKNNQYPSLKISGQFLQLTDANIDSKIKMGGSSSEGSSPIKVSQLFLGQANVSMPIFNGFKLKNSISASENLYKAETANAANTKEQLSIYVVELFAKLFQSQQTATLIEDNLKSAQQRTKDFSAMVDNGLMARNDLLKSQLQESNIQLSLDTAKKNANIINYQLATLLQLPENTQIDIDIETVKSDMAKNQGLVTEAKRGDLEALSYQQKASEAGIKIAKSGYYPSLALVGGYIAFDLKDVMTVTNAMNIGVGLSYDLASIFKNGKEVKLAKSKAEQTKTAVSILTNKIKEETHEAQENYNLSLKQNGVYTQAVEQATENYRIVKDKYDNSLSTTNDLLEADVQQLQTKINLALSQADIALKYYQLQFASGKLINSFYLSKN